jgi:hypothetical protein
MKVLVVSYDLKRPGQNYEKLIALMKIYPWARLGGSAYLILTAQDPAQVRDYLTQALDSGDQIYIGVAPAPSAWWNLPEDVSKWILANQK